MAVVAPPNEGGDTLLSPVSPQLPVGTPLFEFVRVYSSVPNSDFLESFKFKMEFRPESLDEWTESVEGDTSIHVNISEQVFKAMSEHWEGAYSLIISLVSNIMIHRVTDRHITESGFRYSSYVYDSYYVKQIVKEEGQRNYRMVCVGMKEYLGKRLAIPAGRNTIDGSVTVPDGTQESKPIPTSQLLRFTNTTPKGVIRGLLEQTANLQALPLSSTATSLAGTMQRTYLMKDLLTIKEAIDNLLDDQYGPESVIFDGGYGTRSQVSFFFTTTGIERGNPYTIISGRSSPIFTPQIETVANEVVNNLWAIGNASDGNVLMAHKIQPGSAGKILLQEARTERSDIQTSSFLLSYTLGVLETSGQSIRTMKINTGLTQDMFLAFVDGWMTFKTPEEPDIDETSWRIVARTINPKDKVIVFELVEYISGDN